MLIYVGARMHTQLKQVEVAVDLFSITGQVPTFRQPERRLSETLRRHLPTL